MTTEEGDNKKDGQEESRPTGLHVPHFSARAKKLTAVFVLAAAGIAAVYEAATYENNHSTLMSKIAGHLAKKFGKYEVVPPGPGVSTAKAPPGPGDQRAGYAQQAEQDQSLESQGYALTAQANSQTPHLGPLELYPIYRIKPEAGVKIVSSDTNEIIYEGRFPHQAYPDFESIPPLLARSLAYVEDRGLLEKHPDTWNPAINWWRFGKAVIGQLAAKAHIHYDHSGASTLWTQSVKDLDSPEGRTAGGGEKVRQMLTASARAKLYDNPGEAGELNYINTVPFSSYPHFGEVIGFADALHIWFGEDLDEANRLLSAPQDNMNDAELAKVAKVYREVLSLVMAVKKPSYYFLQTPSSSPGEINRPHFSELQKRVDEFLPSMSRDGIITPRFAAIVKNTAVVPADPEKRDRSKDAPREKYIQFQRNEASKLLGVDRLYDLDRMDVKLFSPMDAGGNKEITAYLHSLHNPDSLRAANMTGYQLAQESYASKLEYAYALYEKVKMPDGKTVLLQRIQTDTNPGPLNTNTGTREQMGSSMKPWVDAYFLERVKKMHEQYAEQDPAGLKAKIAKTPSWDPITRNTLGYLLDPDTDKSLMANMDSQQTTPRYPANPGERFFTAGGVHYVHNFNRDEDGKTYSPETALIYSVNVSYVRIMRDVVNNIIAQDMNIDQSIFDDINHPLRRPYLEKFAYYEGTKNFLDEAWANQIGRHDGKPKVPDEKALSPERTAELLVKQMRRTPGSPKYADGLAIIYNATHPDRNPEGLKAFMMAHHGGTEKTDYSKYAHHGPETYDLNDRAYLAKLRNPMEIWLAEWRMKNPKGTFEQAAEAAKPAQLEAYRWLINPKPKPDPGTATPQELYKWEAREARIKGRQNDDIQTMLQVEAFEIIRQQWVKWGYPFKDIVPSYEDAIGVSGMTSEALAIQMSLHANDGVRVPIIRIQEVRRGEGTPFEKINTYKEPDNAAQQVMSHETVTLLRRAEQGVVSDGTARRSFNKTTLSDGTILPTLGKTGTSANENDRVVDYVNDIDDRFIEVVRIKAAGRESNNFHFTSATAVQLSNNIHRLPSVIALFDRARGIHTVEVAANDEKPAAKAPPNPRPFLSADLQPKK